MLSVVCKYTCNDDFPYVTANKNTCDDKSHTNTLINYTHSASLVLCNLKINVQFVLLKLLVFK